MSEQHPGLVKILNFATKHLDYYISQDYLSQDLTTVPCQNGFQYPGSRSKVSLVPVVSARRLTQDGSIKTTLMLTIDIKVCSISILIYTSHKYFLRLFVQSVFFSLLSLFIDYNLLQQHSIFLKQTVC